MRMNSRKSKTQILDVETTIKNKLNPHLNLVRLSVIKLEIYTKECYRSRAKQ